jgi:hypothetical protein
MEIANKKREEPERRNQVLAVNGKRMGGAGYAEASSGPDWRELPQKIPRECVALITKIANG